MTNNRFPLLAVVLSLAACAGNTPSRNGNEGSRGVQANDSGAGIEGDGNVAPSPSTQPAFVCGYNFGDPSARDATIDGRVLRAQEVVGSSSLEIAGVGGPVNPWTTTIPTDVFVPAADDELAELLNHHISASDGSITIRQGVSNGRYQVYTYHMENNDSHWRSFHVAVQGKLVTSTPVDLEHAQWVKLGPFTAQVTDSVLRIELQRISGDASIMGLEIWSTTGGKVQDLPAGGGDGGTPPPPADGGVAPQGPWKLVWADEFNGSGLPDSTRWDYEVGYVRNNEEQYYAKARLENAHVANGYLTIEARKDNYQGHPITSASLITKGKASWTYGRIEVRAQIPTGQGSWPAIWTLGTDIDQVGWPACGEIDIMENVGFEPDTIYGTVHLPGVDDGGHYKASAPYKGFHVYAVEWFPDRLDFYYDNNKYFTYSKSGAGGAFDKPQYLILNIAVGGAWGGAVDGSIFPLKMLVDYVRVYQYKP